MTITTVSSREFNQAASKAKKAAAQGPVFITDRGKPAHVLITFEAYKKLGGGPRKIADLLFMPDAADAELELPMQHDLAHGADFS